jgi:hypothetical protein
LTGRDFERTANAVATQTFTERLGRGQPALQPTTAKELPAPNDAYRAYGAMAAEGIAETCDIQGWLENTQIATGLEIQYRFLMQVGYVGEEQLKLFLPDCIVAIDGMYLRELRRKLARRQVTFIQQYSAKVWPTPPPKGKPIVERIEIVRL